MPLVKTKARLSKSENTLVNRTQAEDIIGSPASREEQIQWAKSKGIPTGMVPHVPKYHDIKTASLGRQE